MENQYRVLWFDDQLEYIEAVEDKLNRKISPYGLELQSNKISSFDVDSINPILDELRRNSNYDIILVDFDLGQQNETGATLLTKLRRYSQGEVIFYSAKKPRELREMLLDLEIDGVFCVSRGISLADDIFSIIRPTFHRLAHPNYFRGIVVGSVSEMDELLSDILLRIVKKSRYMDEEELRALAAAGLKESIDMSVSALATHVTRPIDRFVAKDLNLYIKVNLILQVLDRIGDRLSEDCSEILKRFNDEINQYRIQAAHVANKEVNGALVFTGRTEKPWDVQKLKEILTAIRSHKDNLNSILALVDKE